jgi:OOP family OmpA-OmpF porin
MKLRNKACLAALFVTAVGVTADAAAQAYGGVGVGYTRNKLECGGFACDRDDTGYKIFGGYNFHPYFGVEAAYVDLGKASASVPTTAGTLFGEVSTQGPAIFAVAKAEDATWKVFGKLGFAFMNTEVKASLGSLSASEDDTHTNPAWGLGIGWKVSRNILVQVEYERFRSELSGEKSWVEFTSLGVVYNF